MGNGFMSINIVLTTLSLLYIVLLYFGYIRLFKLRTYSCEEFSKAYLKTPRTQSKGKVIVSIGTNKTNFSDIKPTINSILDQTVHADQIILSTQKPTDIVVPDYLVSQRIINVHRMCENYKGLLCLLSPLIREKDADTKIILVSDNQVYGEDFIETLVEASEQAPNSVIFTRGYNAKKSLALGEKVYTPHENDVIDLTGGVLVKPKFFEEDILNLESQPENIENNPDVFLSSYLHKKKIHFVEIKYNENFGKTKKLLPDSDKLVGYHAALFPSFN